MRWLAGKAWPDEISDLLGIFGTTSTFDLTKTTLFIHTFSRLTFLILTYVFVVTSSNSMEASSCSSVVGLVRPRLCDFSRAA